MKKFSKVPNNTGITIDDDVICDALKNEGYSQYFDEKVYKRSIAGPDKNQGSKGFWTKEIAGVGVQNPIAFYIELYSFSKINSSDVDTFVISFRYDTNFNLNTDIDSITKLDGMSALNAFRSFNNGIKLKNGYDVIGTFESLSDVKMSIENDVKKYNVLKIKIAKVFIWLFTFL